MTANDVVAEISAMSVAAERKAFDRGFAAGKGEGRRVGYDEGYQIGYGDGESNGTDRAEGWERVAKRLDGRVLDARAVYHDYPHKGDAEAIAAWLTRLHRTLHDDPAAMDGALY